MACTHRRQAADLIRALREHPARFDFFQAVRLLRTPDERLHIRPELGLGFPVRDIAALEAMANGDWRMTVTFGGLYGVASALPTYDTEDLLDERSGDGHSTRDFLDILHHAIYLQLFQAWAKPRLARSVVEERNATTLASLHALLGLGDASIRTRTFDAKTSLLRHAAALGRWSRGAVGLTCMLADLFPKAEVGVDGGCLYRASIPLQQRWRLGTTPHALGRDSTLGARIDDAGALRIRLGALAPRHYRQLLPGHGAHTHLRAILQTYLDHPMHTTLQLHCSRAEPARCGGKRWCVLGHDCWLLRSSCTHPSGSCFVITP